MVEIDVEVLSLVKQSILNEASIQALHTRLDDSLGDIKEIKEDTHKILDKMVNYEVKQQNHEDRLVMVEKKTESLESEAKEELKEEIKIWQTTAFKVASGLVAGGGVASAVWGLL